MLVISSYYKKGKKFRNIVEDWKESWLNINDRINLNEMLQK